MTISANDIASETQANPRLDHYVAVSTVVIGINSFREGNEAREECVEVGECFPIEIAELEQQRPQLFTQQVHRAQELL